MRIEDMVTSSTECPDTGDMTVTLTEVGRMALADLLDMVEIPDATDDPIQRYECDNVRTLLEELKRLV